MALRESSHASTQLERRRPAASNSKKWLLKCKCSSVCCSGCSQLVPSNLMGEFPFFFLQCPTWHQVHVLIKLGCFVIALSVWWAGQGPAVGLRKKKPRWIVEDCHKLKIGQETSTTHVSVCFVVLIPKQFSFDLWPRFGVAVKFNLPPPLNHKGQIWKIVGLLV